MHHLQYATEASLFITDCYVCDVDKEARLIDPEIDFVFLSVAELLDNLLYEVDTGTRVAVLHITPDYVLASWEDPVVGVRVETNNLTLVHIREVYGEVFIDEVDLLEGHLPLSYVQ